MKRGILMAAFAAAGLLLASCNTVQGIGQDIKDGGKAMSNAINGTNDADREFNKGSN